MSPDRWLQLCAELPAEEADPELRTRLARALMELGGTAVEERRGELCTSLPPPEDLESLLGRARRLVGAASGEGPALRWEWRADRDWLREWRRGLRPRRVGERLVVAPTWTEPEPAPGELLIRLDPGMAFGTGEHGTTRGALRLLERTLEPGDRVLDVGTGTGVLAVAAVRLGARRVVALERDPDAVKVAGANLELNGVVDSVVLLELNADRARLALLRPLRFDVITANLLLSDLEPLLPALSEVTDDRTRLVAAGLLEEERERWLASARPDWVLRAEERDGGWWSGLLRRGAVGEDGTA